MPTLTLPLIVNAQLTLESNYDTTFQNRDLRDIFLSDSDKVTYYMVDSDSTNTYRMDIDFKEHGNRSILITTDKTGNILSIVVIEDKWNQYQLDFDVKNKKILSFESIFWKK